MSLLKEFKEFAMKGNVVDMAVGIVIGAAFGKIVNSVVSDLFMPLIGAVMAGKNFSDQFLWLGGGDETPLTLEAAKTAGGAYVAWGSFVQVTIDFLIVALALFLVVKAMNKARGALEAPKAPAAAPEPPEDIRLLREIRDALQKA
jgi:large conductance mechanosensitive channel